MTYSRLYEHCQGLAPKVRRKEIRNKVLQLSGKNQVRAVKTTLDTSLCRGFYLAATNTDHQFVRQCGCDVIVIARGLNQCWDRMVYVKELMHLFDPLDCVTDCGESLEIVLSEFLTAGPAFSAPTAAEWYAIWMALSVLCPEAKRLEFDQQRQAGLVNDYDIALQLKIPEQYVPNLFEARYRPIIDHLLTRT